MSGPTCLHLHPARRPNAGTALFYALLVLVILSLISGLAYSLIAQQQRGARQVQLRAEAHEIARSALTWMVWQLKQPRGSAAPSPTRVGPRTLGNGIAQAEAVPVSHGWIIYASGFVPDSAVAEAQAHLQAEVNSAGHVTAIRLVTSSAAGEPTPAPETAEPAPAIAAPTQQIPVAPRVTPAPETITASPAGETADLPHIPPRSPVVESTAANPASDEVES